MTAPLAPLAVTMPGEPGVFVLAVRLEDASGTVLHRNFITYIVEGDLSSGTFANGEHVRASRVPATHPSDATWSLKQWTVLGDKLNGARSGFVEYRMPWPAGLAAQDVARATFLVEASAKRVNGKDRDTTATGSDHYMRGGGFHDRSRNPHSYPMTSESPSRDRRGGVRGADGAGRDRRGLTRRDASPG